MSLTAAVPVPSTSFSAELHRLLECERAELLRAEESNDVVLVLACTARIDDLIGLAERNDIALPRTA